MQSLLGRTVTLSVFGLCFEVTIKGKSYIFLLLVDVANLEPDVFLGKWPRWVMYDVLEALRKN